MLAADLRFDTYAPWGRARSIFGSPFSLSGILFQVAFVSTALVQETPAYAYRPFDGTDAAVADYGELEVELQPVGWRIDNGDGKLVAPAVVLNFGIAKNWEAVLQGQLETPLSSSEPVSLTETGAFLKHVLREGSLQDKAGPSIATEFGVLLPGVNAESGLGASWAGIVSQRWDWGTAHFNVETSLTRDQHAEVFLDTILEGPSKWKVRPVGELFFEEKFGEEQTVSGLVGLIWQVRDNVAVDFAVRAAETNGHPVEEVRAGVTFGVPFFRSSKK